MIVNKEWIEKSKEEKIKILTDYFTAKTYLKLYKFFNEKFEYELDEFKNGFREPRIDNLV